MSDTEILDAPAKVAEYRPVDAGLAQLRTKLAGVQFDVTTTAGDKAARAARQECVKLRTTVEATRKELKAPLLARAKLLDDEAKRITAAVLEIEEPIDAQIKAEEQRKAAIKAEQERLERERQEAIQQRIWMLGQYAVSAAGLPSAKIAAMRETLAAEPISTELYAHRAGEAMALQAEVAAKLEQMHAAALAQEQEAARLAAERAELERQRQEQEAAARAEREAEAARLRAEREALEQARREEEARQAAARAEEQRRQEQAAAELRRQQDEIECQRREFEEQQAAARRAEQERLDTIARAEREKAAAEARALREKEEAERAAAARREAEQFALRGPGDAEIVRVLAEHYDVLPGDVIGWLRNFNPDTAAVVDADLAA